MSKLKIFAAILFIILLTSCKWPWTKEVLPEPVSDLTTISADIPTSEIENSKQALFWPYFNDKYAYQISYPVETWILNKADTENVEIIYQGETDKVRIEDKAKLIINVETTEEENLEEIVSTYGVENRFIQYSENGEIILAIFDMPDGSRQTLAFKDGRIYKITVTMESEVLKDNELFKNLQADIEKMIHSFSLK